MDKHSRPSATNQDDITVEVTFSLEEFEHIDSLSFEPQDMVRRIVQAHMKTFDDYRSHQAKKISDRTKKALEAKKARGDKEWRVGGFTAKDRAKSLAVRKENRLNNADYQRALSFILLLRKDGLTWRDIAARCNESGFTTRTGAKIMEGSAHRMVKYHWADYVHDKWNASRESTLNPYTKVQDLPKAFREACEDKYSQAHGIYPSNRFKHKKKAKRQDNAEM